MGFDVITVGSATRDLFLKVDLLQERAKRFVVEQGRKYEIAKPFVETGGGATNVAVGLARLGLRTAVVTKVGDDGAGHLIKRSLEQEGVSTRFVIEEKKVGTAMAFIFWKQGVDRTVFVYRGASEELRVQQMDWKVLKARWLYVSALAGKSVKILKPLLLYAKKQKIKVACNPGAAELKMRWILRFVDVLIVNKEEAEQLAGVRGSAKQAMQKLATYGPRMIVVTDGPGMVRAYDRGRIYQARPFEGKIESTLGAGDAFAAGFMGGLLQHKSVQEAVKWGCLNAASVMQHLGAKVKLLRWQELAKFERSFHQQFEVVEE